MSIEQAATKAGVGAKTWGNYEAGGSIRRDKVRAVCKALGLTRLPDVGTVVDTDDPGDLLSSVGPEHVAWSPALAEVHGTLVAAVFAAASDEWIDQISEDLAALAARPRGTHIGELDHAWLEGELPDQFRTRYDYEFVYQLRTTIHELRTRFSRGDLVAHTVLEELALYLLFGQAEVYADLFPQSFPEGQPDWREWVGDICDDLDCEYFLFNPMAVVSPRIAYHFDHWLEPQFYVRGEQLTDTERAAALLRTLHPSSLDTAEA
jgi:hypothetical protein